MSFDKSLEKLLFAEINLMSKQIASLKGEEFRKEVACLDKKYGEIIAICQTYIQWFKGSKEDKEFNEFLKKQAIPLFKKLGIVYFNCDILTELGFKLGMDKPLSFKPRKGKAMVKADNDVSELL